MKFGFFSAVASDDNPWDTEPTVSAYFDARPTIADPNVLEVVGVIRATNADPVETAVLIADVDKSKSFDYVIEINGTTDVKFFAKGTDDSWGDPETVTTGLPNGELYYSISSQNIGSQINNVTAKVFEFELTR